MADMFRPVPIEQEPKRNNRFVLEFPTELGIESFLVQTSGKPHLEIGNTEIPYMNTSTWVAGRSKWGTIEVKFIDVIGPSTTQKIMEWVRLIIYLPRLRNICIFKLRLEGADTKCSKDRTSPICETLPASRRQNPVDKKQFAMTKLKRLDILFLLTGLLLLFLIFGNLTLSIYPVRSGLIIFATYAIFSLVYFFIRRQQNYVLGLLHLIFTTLFFCETFILDHPPRRYYTNVDPNSIYTVKTTTILLIIGQLFFLWNLTFSIVKAIKQRTQN